MEGRELRHFVKLRIAKGRPLIYNERLGKRTRAGLREVPFIARNDPRLATVT